MQCNKKVEDQRSVEYFLNGPIFASIKGKKHERNERINQGT
jgi:hypothetical protein